ncbi:putative ABC transport system permease protein [Asanoa ferruginea]|uniref:Putative ABC transport system permease protein n=1 Tax=Asanoa ferruginea TaxID=53367 RepID=A0A3D9ZSU9_9ACTN|nr:ABC transporter permease [Asanoa ferruginea]REG00312.1 putative ABC transport system permease protein [Asanoa ferruginea]GIF51903.1 transporter [Asanoa ferruginea]
MVTLALRTLRHRTGGFLATFAATFLGATILMAFASLLDTAAAGVDPATRETLTLMASVAGGWCLVIVAFAVASTLTLAARQRDREMALLRSIGATPAQVGRMIVVEAAVVAFVAAVVAIPAGYGLGRLLFRLLVETEQVAAGVAYRFGVIAVGIGVGVTVVGALLATLVTTRRIARPAAQQLVADEPRRMGWKRVTFGWLLVAAGVNCGLLTVLLFSGAGSDAMQTAGQASIWVSAGLALLSPVLIRGVTAVLAVPLTRFGGASGYLTVANLRRRSQQMAGALMPIILFTGISLGTLVMQSVENRATDDGGTIPASMERNIETLNLVVVGMLALFAAIMLVNTLVAATTYRRREFGQQRLTGATPGQVRRMVGAESAVLAFTGVLFGSLASLATILPFTIARTDRLVPDAPALIWPAIAVVAVVLTMTASIGTARRALRTPATEAVGLTA